MTGLACRDACRAARSARSGVTKTASASARSPGRPFGERGEVASDTARGDRSRARVLLVAGRVAQPLRALVEGVDDLSVRRRRSRALGIERIGELLGGRLDQGQLLVLVAGYETRKRHAARHLGQFRDAAGDRIGLVEGRGEHSIALALVVGSRASSR